ncbi:MAG: hypothetical protein ABR899_09370, partial [Candidatus Krumholzibacteriaceae bacterium]
MRSFGTLAVIVAVCVAGCPAARGGPAASGAPAPPDRARERRVFVLKTGETRVELGMPFIVPGSDSVTVDGKPLARGNDYRINTLRGSIVLVKSAAGGERLVVRFSRYPLPFAPVFASHVAEGEAPLPLEPLAPPAKPQEERRAAEPYQLRLSGSKTVGIDVGSNKD